MTIHTADFTPAEENVLLVIIQSCSSLSLIGASFIIFSYILFREFRLFHLRLILYLSICDVATSIVYLAGPHLRYIDEGRFCLLTAAGLEFFVMASVLWTGCISHTLDQVIRKRNDYIESWEKWYHLLCWGVPLSFTLSAYFTNRFGDAGLWCWINRDKEGIFRFAYFYGPLVLILIYMAVTYILVSRKLNHERKNITRMTVEQDKEHAIQTTFRWFVLVLFFCWIPGIVNRIQNTIAPDSPIFWLNCIHAAFSPLQGFFNSIIYGFNDELRSNYKQLLAKCCGRPQYNFLTIQEQEETQFLKEALREYEYND